eukprot:PhF_6_TR10364/c0_g1_i3/m.16084
MSSKLTPKRLPGGPLELQGFYNIPPKPTNTIQWSPSSIVAATYGHHIHFFDTGSLQHISSIEHPTSDPIVVIQWGPSTTVSNRSVLAAGNTTGDVIVWDVGAACIIHLAHPAREDEAAAVLTLYWMSEDVILVHSERSSLWAFDTKKGFLWRSTLCAPTLSLAISVEWNQIAYIPVHISGVLFTGTWSLVDGIRHQIDVKVTSTTTDDQLHFRDLFFDTETRHLVHVVTLGEILLWDTELRLLLKSIPLGSCRYDGDYVLHRSAQWFITLAQ